MARFQSLQIRKNAVTDPHSLQVETGNPYMLYKDACNRKSNQQNLGTIKSSNLCTEIVEYTAPDETAVCNLASIALPRFVCQNGVPQGAGYKKLAGSLDAPERWYDFEKVNLCTFHLFTLPKLI